MESLKNDGSLLFNEEVRKLVLARLSVLSSDTVISLGSEGSFNRDELVQKVQDGDRVGEKLAEMQMGWLQSFKEGINI